MFLRGEPDGVPVPVPQENGLIVFTGSLSRPNEMEPSQTPGWRALSNAFTVAPGRCVPKGEYPLVFIPPLESNTLLLSTTSLGLERSVGAGCLELPSGHAGRMGH